MFIETALKNYVLEIVLEESKSDNFIFIYDNLLTKYRNYQVGSPNYKKAINKRLKLRNNVYNTLS
ncbi:hypothetical protein HYH98_01630 [Clostridium botulinum]|nr:hypothetical protein [Clostridium botulinum]